MQKGLNSTVEMLLFVNREPAETSRSYIQKDGQGKEVGEVSFTEQTLRGYLMSDVYGQNVLDMEIKIRPDQVKSSFPEAPKFGDLLRTFIRDEQNLATGKKLILAEVSNHPVTRKTGEKAGVTDSLVPVLVGFKVVDAKPEDIAMVEGILTARNELTANETTERATVA